jgi:hypothetical protein
MISQYTQVNSGEKNNLASLLLYDTNRMNNEKTGGHTDTDSKVIS